MKKIFILLILIVGCFLVSGCSSKKNLVGKWNTVELTKGNQSFDLLTSNIEFIEKDGTFKAKGCAGLNLFVCQVEVKGKKINAFAMQNTGFTSTIPELDYEDAFFTALMYADSYKIEGDYLYLFSSVEDAKIKFQKGLR